MPVLGLDWAELQAAWERVRDSGQFTEGYFVRAFEDEVSQWCGMHAVAVNSCGSGLFAVYCLLANKKKENRVLVSNNTFYATGAMAREAGWGVVLSDCSLRDFALDVFGSRHLIRDVDMVVLTHVGGGLSKNYRNTAGWCGNEERLLVEDAAHVLGVKWNGLTAGSLGKAAVFSLYPTKAIPAGEGGVVVTKDKVLADRLREFRNYGKHLKDGKIAYHRGFNLRMDEWTAAVALLQMRRREQILELRNRSAELLTKAVGSAMVDWASGETNWYKFPFSARRAAELGLKRFTGKIYSRTDQLAQALGIRGKFPNSEQVADEHVCLPVDEGLYEGMTSQRIIDYLREGA